MSVPDEPPPDGYPPRTWATVAGLARGAAWIGAGLALLGAVTMRMFFGPGVVGIWMVVAASILVLLFAEKLWRHFESRPRDGPRDPRTPWLWDRRWDPRGERRSVLGRDLGRAARGPLRAFFLLGVLLVTLWDGRGTRISAGEWIVLVSFLVSAAVFCVLSLRVVLQGGLSVVPVTFPLRTGGPVAFDVASLSGGSSARDVRCVLRCLRTHADLFEEEIEVVLRGTQDVPQGYGPDEPARVEFQIPASAPGSQLRGDDTVHWELVVLGVTGWGPVCERFVVPVYAVTASAPAL